MSCEDGKHFFKIAQRGKDAEGKDTLVTICRRCGNEVRVLLDATEKPKPPVFERETLVTGELKRDIFGDLNYVAKNKIYFPEEKKRSWFK